MVPKIFYPFSYACLCVQYFYLLKIQRQILHVLKEMVYFLLFETFWPRLTNPCFKDGASQTSVKSLDIVAPMLYGGLLHDTFVLICGLFQTTRPNCSVPRTGEALSLGAKIQQNDSKTIITSSVQGNASHFIQILSSIYFSVKLLEIVPQMLNGDCCTIPLL